MNTFNCVNIGLIGAGRVAQHYKKILSSGVVTNFQVVGICDIDLSAAANLAEYWSCEYFDSIDKMIYTCNPDLVLVLTPSGMHYEHARIALNLNCNVLVEKPLTLIPHQSRELMELAKLKNKMLGVVFQNRFNPAICALSDAIRMGRFGRIVTATIRLRWCRYQEYYNDGWHGTWSQDGGVINQQAIHHVDTLNWLVGPIDSVCSVMGNRLNQLEAEDTIVAILKFSNGALGTIEATTAARPIDVEASISIIGEGGIAEIGGIALNKIEKWQFVKPLDDDLKIPYENSIEVPSGYGLSHGILLKNTISSLLNGSIIPQVTVQESIYTSELIHAIYSSFEKSGWVKLKDSPLSINLGKQH